MEVANLVPPAKQKVKYKSSTTHRKYEQKAFSCMHFLKFSRQHAGQMSFQQTGTTSAFKKIKLIPSKIVLELSLSSKNSHWQPIHRAGLLANTELVAFHPHPPFCDAVSIPHTETLYDIFKKGMSKGSPVF